VDKKTMQTHRQVLLIFNKNKQKLMLMMMTWILFSFTVLRRFDNFATDAT